MAYQQIADNGRAALTEMLAQFLRTKNARHLPQGYNAIMNPPLRIHRYPLAAAIHRSPEFAKKKLADLSVNVGVKCGHACTYCSSGTVLRCHRAFRELSESPFKNGYAIVDPDIPEKVAAECKRIRKRGLVQLCTTVDAWCPAAQQHDLGRRCLEALLSEPGWTVRILTKNTAVARDFDLVEKHRERVLVGLSLTGTADSDKVLAVVEPTLRPFRSVCRCCEKPATAGFARLACCARCCRALQMPRRKSKNWWPSLIGAASRKYLPKRSISGARDQGHRGRVAGVGVSCRGGLASPHSPRQNWSAYVADLIHDLQVALRT